MDSFRLRLRPIRLGPFGTSGSFKIGRFGTAVDGVTRILADVRPPFELLSHGKGAMLGCKFEAGNEG